MNKEEKAFIERFVRNLVKENGRKLTRDGLMLGRKNSGNLPLLQQFYLNCLLVLDAPFTRRIDPKDLDNKDWRAKQIHVKPPKN